MSFTEEKFENLNRENRLKKVIFALKQYRDGQKEQQYIVSLIQWLNHWEKMAINLSEDLNDIPRLADFLLNVLKGENPYLEIEPFDKESQPFKKFPVKVLLDNIRSPYNVGSVLRSSEGFGIEEVLLCGITPTPENNQKVLKTAMSAKVKYSSCQSTLELINSLKEQSYYIIALEKTNNSIDISQFRFQDYVPAVIVLGNEEFGLSGKVLDCCDHIVHINMHGFKNSLNVSVAAGITFHTAVNALSAR